MPSAKKDSDPAVVIREMTETDLSAVLDIEEDIFRNPWSSDSFEHLLSEPGWGAIVADIGGQVAAYACYVVDDLEAHLANIAVAPTHRRKSVAKRLLRHILRVVKREECRCILLEVRPGNKAALAFYDKHDFHLMYRWPGYYRNPVEDALVMVRYLHNNQRDR